MTPCDEPGRPHGVSGDKRRRNEADVGDRIVIGLLCAPTAILVGWCYLQIRIHGLSPSRGWFTWVVEIGLGAWVGTLFAMLGMAVGWAVTGRRWWNAGAYRLLLRLVLVTLALAAVLFTLHAILGG